MLQRPPESQEPTMESLRVLELARSAHGQTLSRLQATQRSLQAVLGLLRAVRHPAPQERDNKQRRQAATRLKIAPAAKFGCASPRCFGLTAQLQWCLELRTRRCRAECWRTRIQRTRCTRSSGTRRPATCCWRRRNQLQALLPLRVLLPATWVPPPACRCWRQTGLKPAEAVAACCIRVTCASGIALTVGVAA